MTKVCAFGCRPIEGARRAALVGLVEELLEEKIAEEDRVILTRIEQPNFTACR